MRYRQTIAVLALVGLFVALYLWLHALGFGGAIKCGASGGCEVVQTSPWAAFLGLPVAFYGVVGYLALLVVALAALRPAARTQLGWTKLFTSLRRLPNSDDFKAAVDSIIAHSPSSPKPAARPAHR